MFEIQIWGALTASISYIALGDPLYSSEAVHQREAGFSFLSFRVPNDIHSFVHQKLQVGVLSHAKTPGFLFFEKNRTTVDLI